MEFRVLGLLELRTNGVVVLSTRKQIVLAALAVKVNRVVGVDEMWPDERSQSAMANVRAYVGEARQPSESAQVRYDRMRCRAVCHLLHADSSDLDILALLADCIEGQARFRFGDVRTGAGRFEQARTTWRSPAIGVVPCGSVPETRFTALNDERFAVTDEPAEPYLTMNERGRTTTLLRDHVGTYPLRKPNLPIKLEAFIYGQPRTG